MPLSIEALQRFERQLARHDPDRLAMLAPGANDVELMQLPCPNHSASLTNLYRWRNGQTGTSSYYRHYIWLNCEDVLEVWHFFNDPSEEIMQPYLPSWLPILDNGAGDYVMFDCESEKLIRYRHDEKDRRVVFDSLSDWIKAMSPAD